MSPEDRDRDVGVLAERVRRLEDDREADRKALERFSARVDQQFEQLRVAITTSIAGIAYVPRDLYERDRGSMERAMTDARSDAENARKVAWGAVTILTIAVIGAIVSVAFRVAA